MHGDALAESTAGPILLLGNCSGKRWTGGCGHWLSISLQNASDCEGVHCHRELRVNRRTVTLPVYIVTFISKCKRSALRFSIPPRQPRPCPRAVMKTARSKGTPCLMTLFKVPGGTHPQVGLLYDPVLGAQQFNGKHEGCDDHTVTLTYPHTDQCILTVKESSQLLAVRIQ